MKKLILLAAASALSTSASAQTRAPDPARLKATVEKLVRFGTRHTLSSATDPKRGIGADPRVKFLHQRSQLFFSDFRDTVHDSRSNHVYIIHRL